MKLERGSRRRETSEVTRVEPLYLHLMGKGQFTTKPQRLFPVGSSRKVERPWPLLTSLLSATMMSSTYLVVAWTSRLNCYVRDEKKKKSWKSKEGGFVKIKYTDFCWNCQNKSLWETFTIFILQIQNMGKENERFDLKKLQFNTFFWTFCSSLFTFPQI